jgi:predicted Co/Zn/Cd cation transporter (cation efflux family)
VTEIKQGRPIEGNLSDAVKSWIMVLLTLAFVVLYGFALLGKLKPLADASMVTRLEPLVFVIIGYYFGRLPGAENEQTLKDEIGRQTRRADAAQQSTEAALQSREVLDEKIKNARTALDNASVERSSVATAFRILSS